jgi:D-alanine-D-alanine ligase-like ATP-grasp enzyme
MKKLKVGVIFGGKSFEKEVSLATGRYVYQLLDQECFLGIPLFMDKKGRLWKISDKLVLLLVNQLYSKPAHLVFYIPRGARCGVAI